MPERRTAQKAAVMNVLAEADAPLGVQEILDLASQVTPSISQATVYRVLKSLLKKQTISLVQLPGETPLYEMAGKHHHHFFRCRTCRQMYEVQGCDELIQRLLPDNFTLEDHEVFLFGLCANCRR
jgi:Fur family ferric uptake transcriptional regulator